MTALSIVQSAAARLGLSIPSVLFSATDAQTIQLRTLLNEEGVGQMEYGGALWTRLTKEQSFTTIASVSQDSSAMPSDFARFCDGTIWDRSNARPVAGPMSPETWQAWMARPVLASVVYGFRLRGGTFMMAPAPAAGLTIYFEYISNKWVYASGDSAPTKTAFSADTDTSVFNEETMTAGLRWRFLQAKQLPHDGAYEEWKGLLQRDIARDGGMPTLSIALPRMLPLGGPFVPEGSWT